MRRKEREITDASELVNMIERCKVCRIGMIDSEGMYIVPLNFGYEYKDTVLTLFFHCAKEGRKIRALESNGEVCFEMDREIGLIEGEKACGYGYSYESVMGTGTAVLLHEPEDKKKALSLLMHHQTEKEFSFTDEMANACMVFKLVVKNYSGKRHGKA